MESNLCFEYAKTPLINMKQVSRLPSAKITNFTNSLDTNNAFFFAPPRLLFRSSTSSTIKVIKSMDSLIQTTGNYRSSIPLRNISRYSRPFPIVLQFCCLSFREIIAAFLFNIQQRAGILRGGVRGRVRVEEREISIDRSALTKLEKTSVPLSVRSNNFCLGSMRFPICHVGDTIDDECRIRVIGLNKLMDGFCGGF